MSDSKKKVGPDSWTCQKKSDGRSDFFGQKATFRVGQKVGQRSDKGRTIEENNSSKTRRKKILIMNRSVRVQVYSIKKYCVKK